MLFSTRGTHEEDSAQAFLLASHDRTRHFLRVAEHIASVDLGRTLLADVGAAAEDLVRHFGETLPLHERDEMESLAPALAGDPSLAEHLTMLANEHAVLQVILDQLLPLWRRLAAEPRAVLDVKGPLALATRRLVAVFSLHFMREEKSVFPRIGLLSPTAQATLLAEMRGRRGSVLPS